MDSGADSDSNPVCIVRKYSTPNCSQCQFNFFRMEKVRVFVLLFDLAKYAKDMNLPKCDVDVALWESKFTQHNLTYEGWGGERKLIVC